MNIPSIRLSDGNSIPQIGLGLWKNRLPSHVTRAVEAALKEGYRHFDSAQIYGNERFLGSALQKFGVKREELYITTKLWNGNQWPEDALESFDKSLEHLKTDYVDLFLVHFPVTETRAMAWRAMEKIHESGRAKSIGVSNYTVRHLEELLANCRVKPVINQVELHVYLQQPELIAFCKKHDIVVEAYSPLAHAHGMDNEVLQAIADKHGKSTAQVMIRWCIEKGLVPLPKSTHADRIKANIEVFDFALDADDMAKIEKLEANLRTCWDPSNVA